MSRSIDETRREFLRRVAATVAFVPPAMASVAATGLAAQGKSTTTTDGSTTDGGKGKGGTSGGSTTIGSLSPTAQSVSSPTFSLQQSTADAPWQPGGPSKPPPWAAPPPTQTGR